MCQLCFECPFTIDVFSYLADMFKWPSLPIWMSSMELSSFLSTLEVCHSKLPLADLTQFIFVWWHVWSFRNKVIFSNESTSFMQGSFIINSFVKNWDKASGARTEELHVHLLPTTAKKLRPCSGPNLIWAPPSDNFCKLNFDGSKVANGQASYGSVIRNNLGEVLMASVKALGDCHNIILAEAMGMYEGISGAISLRISNLIIEGDNLTVINSLKHRFKPPWLIANIICNADILLDRFDAVVIQQCFREANHTADFMAHKGHLFPNAFFWSPPYCIDFPF